MLCRLNSHHGLLILGRLMDVEWYIIDNVKWASSRENLSSGFPTKRLLKQSPQLQILARKLKFQL